MAEFFDYNPDTGVTEMFEYDPITDKVHIHHTQDVQPLIDYARALRNDSMTDKGIKNSWWRYAVLPATVQMELRKKGINIFSKDPKDRKRLFREINENYPYLKLTDKVHTG